MEKEYKDLRILIINGSAKSGKDTFVELFAKNYPGLCLNWSTIDIVKEIAQNHLGWDGVKTDASRLFLSEFKRIWNEFNNGAYRFMIYKINQHYQSLKPLQKNSVIYFIHCREPEEIERFKNEFGKKCITLLIERPNIEVPNNDSDKNVSGYNYDYSIKNNGTIELLERKAIEFIDELY